MLRRLPDQLLPFGVQIEHHRSIGSTNDRAAALAAAGAPEGTIVIADEQTKGRGRSGNVWFSPSGAGLYVSIVLRPASDEGGLGWPRLITLAAGVALAEGIEAGTGLQASIKWPNDIVLPGSLRLRAAGQRPYGGWRKLAGILAEGASQGGVLEYIVLGLGINVRSSPWPPEIADRAASIEGELGRAVDRDALLVEVLASFRTHYASLRTGDPVPVLARWRRRSPDAQNARVRWTTPGGTVEGTTAGLSDDGALLVIVGSEVRSLSAGELEWL